MLTPPRTTPFPTRFIDVPSRDVVHYLLRSLLLTEQLLGKDRSPGVDRWVRDFRVTLTELLPQTELRALLTEHDALAHRIDRER